MANNRWRASVDNDWSVAGNWSAGVIPGGGTNYDVVFDATSGSNDCNLTLTSNMSNINTIYIFSGYTGTITISGAFTISVASSSAVDTDVIVMQNGNLNLGSATINASKPINVSGGNIQIQSGELSSNFGGFTMSGGTITDGTGYPSVSDALSVSVAIGNGSAFDIQNAKLGNLTIGSDYNFSNVTIFDDVLWTSSASPNALKFESGINGAFLDLNGGTLTVHDFELSSSSNASSNAEIGVRDGTVNVTGDLVLENPVFNGLGNETIIVNGTGAQNIKGATDDDGRSSVSNLIIDKSGGTITFNAFRDIAVSSSFELRRYNGNDLTIGRDLVTRSTTGTVTVDGIGNGGENLSLNGALVVEGASTTCQLSTDLKVGGLELANNTSFDINSKTLTIASANGGGIFDGNTSASGFVTPVTGTIKFTSSTTSSAIIGIGTTIPFNNLTIENAASNVGVYLSGANISIANTLTLTRGSLFNLTSGSRQIITLAPSATISGGSTSDSFIMTDVNAFSSNFYTEVRKAYGTPGSFNFPVGSGAYGGLTTSAAAFRPATVDVTDVGSGAPTQVEVTYVSANPQTVLHNTLNTSTLSSISDNEYWKIEDVNSDGITANITLSSDEGSSSGFTACNQFSPGIAYNDTDDTDTWELYSDATYVCNYDGGTDDLDVSNNAITSFGDFTYCTTHTTPLPVELLFFKAIEEENHVSIEWATTSEQNNDFFEIQRADNTLEWEVIGKVFGAGSSSALIEYRFQDTQPILSVAYYRLRQVDFDGTVSYSAMERVAMTCENFHALIFPNPVRRTLYASNCFDSRYINLYNTQGQLVSDEIKIIANTTAGVMLEVDGLAPGKYVISDGNISKSFIKK
ncbi:MAG: hypothetical protein ABJG47_10025 [Ekhidna sp.]